MVEILIVCTANRARSPAAAQLLADHATQATRSAEVRVSSAGLTVVEGESWLPTMHSAMRRRGIEVRPHTARALLAEDLATADLAITMTEEQRRAVVRMGSSSVMISRCFTLKELERLLSSTGWLREWNGSPDVAAHLHAIRPQVPPAKRREDIADPATGGRRLAQAVLDQIAVAVNRVAPSLIPG